MTTYVAINSETRGRYRRENLDGRGHIVTEMVAIVGGSVMNGILYPEDEVARSYQQLNNLPAPNAHPRIGGKKVSAFHPVAINAYNTGGFVRSPRRDGRRVICEFWLDTEVANRTDDGRELVRRIENGERVGVSTGLTLNQRAERGEGEDGKPYSWIGTDYQFDHVAVLLNETAAGAHVGTELVVNGETVQLSEVVANELSANEVREQIENLLRKDGFFVFVLDFYPDSKTVIYEETPREGGETVLYRRGYGVSGDVVSLDSKNEMVTRQVTFNPKNKESSDMEDEPKKKEGFTLENAQALLKEHGYTALNAADSAEYAKYTENKSDYAEWAKTRAENLEKLRTEVAENTGLQRAAVDAMDEETLEAINKKLKKTDEKDGEVEENGTPGRKPKINHAPRAGGTPGAATNSSAVVDFLNPPTSKGA